MSVAVVPARRPLSLETYEGWKEQERHARIEPRGWTKSDSLFHFTSTQLSSRTGPAAEHNEDNTAGKNMDARTRASRNEAKTSEPNAQIRGRRSHTSREVWRRDGVRVGESFGDSRQCSVKTNLCSRFCRRRCFGRIADAVAAPLGGLPGNSRFPFSDHLEEKNRDAQELGIGKCRKLDRACDRSRQRSSVRTAS